jgi:serine/threonine-protein kinase
VDLVRLAKACLDTRPERRPADAGAVAQAVAAHRRSVEERLRQAELARVQERERAQALRERQRLRWVLTLAAAGVALLGLLAAGGWLWQRQRDEADRRAAAAATAAAAAADLDAAAAAAQAGEDGRAHEALERAEGRLAGGGPPELRERLGRLRDDLDFAAQLEAARMKALETTKESNTWNWAGADAAYTRAFADRGLDVTGPGAAAAAERIGRSPVKGRLVTALDAWADARRQSGAAGWEGLLEAAGQVDDSGDEPRRRLREAVLRHDPGRLKGLAGDPGVAEWPPADAVLLADALWAVKEREAAVRVLRAAQGRNPGDFWLNVYLGYILGDSSPASRDEAIGFVRAAMATRPHAATAHYNLGALLANQGKPGAAEKEYREALRLRPDYPEAHTNLGILLDRQGQPEEAEQEYREALRIKPDDPVAHNTLGLLLFKQGRLEEAEREYREALRLQPDLPAAHCNLGNLLAVQGKAAAAEREYRETVHLQPDIADAHLNLGVLLGRQNKAAEAEQEYREALRLRPDLPVARYNLGALLDGQGRAAEAEAEYREALRLKPDFPEAHINLGNLLKALGKLAAAEREYREALRLRPDFPEARGNLGHVLRDQGRFREALEEYRRGHELGSRDPKWPYPSAAWVQDCQRLAEWDALLPAVLGGAAAPADADAALGFVRVCQITKRHAAAARLSAAALDAAPGAANDPRTGVRYNAACFAALAGCGQGTDAPAGEGERARLRAQALAWLRADLAAWGKLVRSDDAKVLQAVQGTLRHWKEDADLAGVRDADALDKLPEGERAEWRKLWADVDALLQKTAPAE